MIGAVVGIEVRIKVAYSLWSLADLKGLGFC